MSVLPIPLFYEVKEVAIPETGMLVLIAPDPNAGLRARYSVIRIDSKAGTVACLGRELPLELARKVAWGIKG